MIGGETIMSMVKRGSVTGRVIKTAEVAESSVCLKCGSFVSAEKIDPENKKKCPLCGEDGLAVEDAAPAEGEKKEDDR